MKDLSDLSYSPNITGSCGLEIESWIFSKHSFCTDVDGAIDAIELWFILLQRQTVAAEAANGLWEAGEFVRFVDHLFIFVLRNKIGITSIAVRWPKEDKRLWMYGNIWNCILNYLIFAWQWEKKIVGKLSLSLFLSEWKQDRKQSNKAVRKWLVDMCSIANTALEDLIFLDKRCESIFMLHFKLSSNSPAFCTNAQVNVINFHFKIAACFFTIILTHPVFLP